MAEKTKCGVVAIIGRPNVGKSTMLNTLLSSKISIVTPKPQTTRDNILGIYTQSNIQILFRDTPGLHLPHRALNKRMVQEADRAIQDADILLMITDPLPLEEVLKEDEVCLTRCKKANKPTILVINKVDTISKPELLPLIDLYSQQFEFKEIIPICALTGDGLDLVIKALSKYLPDGPFLYSEDDLSNRPLRFICAEIIRESLTILTHQEIPYSSAVTIEEFVEPKEPEVVRIRATIHVERESQKGIVIGKGGSMLKAIGSMARQEIEKLMGRKVYLELFVKVSEDWTRTEKGLKKVGY